eukprot:Protomagalhaensia_wolfi_Nauph_80__4300@NODE_438_length_2518_cov_37_548205_g330_i0_p1_GENE_NODE_438_length_2518_cov_37_548205_g330_i0NODE_438_length_2518_cov_37_548205_g330_i0_p1_ORF_typecomplete_len409_score29_47DMT_YdcZ/PF04657_13/1_3e11DMT_YdcZ/PF04657_13/3_1e18DUF1218/PF06749_12/98DUF1218/PF06749_12/0_3DUF1218/PF06749_12/1_2e04_NODE_438_length_2518_cov_37_548205_g330_i02341460
MTSSCDEVACEQRISLSTQRTRKLSPYAEVTLEEATVTQSTASAWHKVPPEDSLTSPDAPSVSDQERENPLWVTCLIHSVPFIAGCFVPVQAALNSMAAETSGNLFFVVGWIYVIDVTITAVWAWWTNSGNFSLQSNFLAVAEFAFPKPIRFICLSNGLLGCVINMMMGLVAAGGGAGVYSLGSLLGSLVASLILQWTGWLWSPKQRPNWLFFLGVAGTAAGAMIYNIAKLMDPELSASSLIINMVLAVIGGVCACCQAAMSNKLGNLIGGLRRSVAWSFWSGLWIMFLLAPYVWSIESAWELFKPQNIWQLSHSPLAVLTIVALSATQRFMPGPLVFGYYIVGQLLASAIFDHFGWIGLEMREIDWFKGVGFLIVIVGVVLITLARLSGAKKADTKETRNSLTEAGP